MCICLCHTHVIPFMFVPFALNKLDYPRCPFRLECACATISSSLRSLTDSNFKLLFLKAKMDSFTPKVIEAVKKYPIIYTRGAGIHSADLLQSAWNKTEKELGVDCKYIN